jgi:hypothetical protein
VAAAVAWLLAQEDAPRREVREIAARLRDLYFRSERSPSGTAAWNFSPEDPDPVAAIRFRMEQAGMEPKDLVPILGSRSRVSEVLNRKRSLRVEMIRRLFDELHIPMEALIPRRADAR